MAGARAQATRRRLRALAEQVARDATPGRRLRIALAAAAVERFADGRPLTVLDAGCEDGLLSLRLAAAHRDWTVVAVDRVLPPLRRGRAEAAARGVRVGYVQADLTAPLPVGVFDAVVSLECLMEVPDDTAALRSMVAALCPGGRFVAQVPTRDWTPVLRGSERAWRREVRHGYDRAELLRWLSGNGLVVESVDGTFHRLTALAQDVRDAVKGRRVWLRAALSPAYLLAVALERRGLRIGRPRAWLVVATKG